VPTPKASRPATEPVNEPRRDSAGEQISKAKPNLKRAQVSRRLDPATAHWGEADSNTAIAAALLQALKRRAGAR
jgi:hypothetical protein